MKLTVVLKVLAAITLAVDIPVADSCTTSCRCYHRYPFSVGEDREYLLGGTMMYSYYSSSIYDRLYIATCNSANLTEVPMGVDGDIRTLDLSNNSITHLKNQVFKTVGLVEVFVMYVNNNSISVIEEDAFIGLEYLKKLVLDYNNITFLPQNVFLTCRTLQYLSLNGNKLIIPESNFVSNLRTLEVLKLAHCGLKSLPSDLYSKKYKYLDISHNELQNVTVNFPVNLLNISNNNRIFLPPRDELYPLLVLNISHSKLSFIPGKNLKAPNLEILSINSCNVTSEEFEILVSNNARIRILELTNNKLEFLPLPSTQSLKNLQELYLGKNKIRYLNQNLFLNNSNLIKINLNGNPLNTTDNAAILQSSTLEILYLQSCNITRINEHTFSKTLNLQELYLDYNLLEYLDDAFHELHKVEVISLEGNKIKSLNPDSFINNIKLKSLTLSRNPLKIPANSHLISAPGLKEIKLNACNITHISGKIFANTPYLLTIRLANNSISTIDVEVFQGLKKLYAVDISGNPLICDARLKKVFQDLYIKHIHSFAHCAVPRGDWRMLEHIHFPEDNSTIQPPVVHSTIPPSPSMSASSTRAIQEEGLSKSVMFILLAVGLIIGIIAGVALDFLLSRKFHCVSLRSGSNWKRILFDRNST